MIRQFSYQITKFANLQAMTWTDQLNDEINLIHAFKRSNLGIEFSFCSLISSHVEFFLSPLVQVLLLVRSSFHSHNNSCFSALTGNPFWPFSNCVRACVCVCVCECVCVWVCVGECMKGKTNRSLLTKREWLTYLPSRTQVTQIRWTKAVEEVVKPNCWRLLESSRFLHS